MERQKATAPYLNNSSSNDSANSFNISNLSAEHTNLYSKIQEGIDDITLGNTRPFTEAVADVKVKRSK